MCPFERSDKEEEYFLKLEAEKLQKAAQKHADETAEVEKQRLKELHYMKCPKCGMDMQEIEYRGVQIDKCFSCGGVYFDDGELEQVVSQDGEGSFLGRISSVFKK